MDYARLASRSMINPDSLSDSYDFVIVGGGLAGLVLGSRLSEDSSMTTLVLEAGSTGDDVIDTISHPGLAYYQGLVGSTYDWQWKSEPQSNANNRVMNWPGGKMLGGSSALNGCYLVRPSAIEVEAWHDLINGMDGADNWTAEKFFAAMDKSETFTPPSSDIQTRGNIQYVASSHGSSGPLHATYPAYLPEVIGSWTATLGNMGIHTSSDPSDGDGSGAFVTTSTINPTNWTRSYSKTAYIDPYDRPNLHILTDAVVTKIVFDGTKATSVQYGDGKSVGVKKEVVLSAGPIGSPATLMRSGVGPRDVLDGAGVSTIVELPGVGQHLQDHLASQVVFSTTTETAGFVHSNPDDARANTPEFLSYVNNAIAYINTAELVGDSSAFRDEVLGQLDAAVSALPSTDESVVAGYKAVYEIAANKLLPSTSGQVELILALMGTSFGKDTISVQTALQRPFSHGRLYINSSNPLDAPVIDPHYMAHPSDLVMLREGLKLARTVGQTEPIKNVITGELSPGANVTTDEEWDAWILNDFHTEYHPSCSCSMLPKDKGGVVDANLKVHGLDNVRVVDSSVFPIEFAAHMMAPTYGLAEQAADMIKAKYGSTSTSSGNNNSSGNNSNSHSGALSSFSGPSLSLTGTMIGLLFSFLLA